MYRSNRSFNIPRAYPGRLTVHLVPGRGGNFNVAWKGGEFEPDLSLVPA